MIQITVGKNTYKSISEAWRAEAFPGLPEITVRWRLKAGWVPSQAFWTPPVHPVDRRLFGEIRLKIDEVRD